MFCGRVEFAGGIWVGVEVGEGEGKNDGSVDGISYFRCAPFRGKLIRMFLFYCWLLKQCLNHNILLTSHLYSIHNYSTLQVCSHL